MAVPRLQKPSAYAMEEDDTEYETADYKWYVCPLCMRCWIAEQMDGHPKICELCRRLPRQPLIMHAEKPEHFMDMTEANIIKPSQEVAIMEGRQHETSALRDSMSGIFNVITQPGEQRVVLMSEKVEVPRMTTTVVRRIMTSLYTQGPTRR